MLTLVYYYHIMKQPKKEGINLREERVFHIRLRNTGNDVNIEKNTHFQRVVEQEYATKYLESLGVEPTQKNIQSILKTYPLKNCQISYGWNTAGLQADTITIIVKGKKPAQSAQWMEKEIDDGGIAKLDLKKMGITTSLKASDVEQEEKKAKLDQKNDIEQQKQLLEKEEEKKIKFRLSFAIEDIKSKYLFPFNQTYQRKQNTNMQNYDRLEFQQNDETHTEHDKFLVFESKLFQLPFVHVEIPAQLLKDVQRPPSVQPEEIDKVLKSISKLFPRHAIPLKEEGQKQIRYIAFDKQIVEQVFAVVESAELVKLVGLFIHLSYWLVFGITQPIQIQSLTKKQIYVSMMDIINHFQSQFKPKIWMHLAMPMILLSIKMATEYIYKNHYPIFFEKPRTNVNTAGNIATDKIFHFADRLFDQNNLFCRFIFLESNFKNQTKVGVDAKYMHKRIFGVSPYLDVLIHNPQNSRTRAIVARQRDIDIRDKILTIGEVKPTTMMPPIIRELGNKEEKQRVEFAQKKKLLNIVLRKMDQDLEQVLKAKQVLQVDR